MKGKIHGVSRVPVDSYLEELRAEFDADDGISRPVKPRKPGVVRKPKKRKRR